MTPDELRELCTLVAELTRLRQNECKNLCIENFAPELLGKLLGERMEIEHLREDAYRWRWLRMQGGWPDSEAAMMNALPDDFDRMADEAMTPNV